MQHQHLIHHLWTASKSSWPPQVAMASGGELEKGLFIWGIGESKLFHPPGQPCHCVPILNTITIGDLNSSITATWVWHPMRPHLTCAKQALAGAERQSRVFANPLRPGWYLSFVPLHLLSVLACFVVVEFCFEIWSHIAQACLELNV